MAHLRCGATGPQARETPRPRSRSGQTAQARSRSVRSHCRGPRRNVGADFADRAGRVDEGLRLLRHLFRQGHGPFEGERFSFQTGVFAPRPTGGLQVMVGGRSDAALRGAARWADVWQSPPMTPHAFAERVARLRASTERRIEVGARTAWSDRHKTVGDLVDEARVWRAAGAEHLRPVDVAPLAGEGGPRDWAGRAKATRSHAGSLAAEARSCEMQQCHPRQLEHSHTSHA
jgi:alkanesulfonate monooxygenase SsuD/methylene tetrahydromethanopterin reductase-like flavin-dependent oxidoreductase (luciferase family)